MASLTNTKIKNTYVSLLKVADNGQLDVALQDITDGAGNTTGIQLNTGGDLTASGTVAFGSLKDSGENITITKFVDAADGIGSNNNDTSLPTSAAVATYVAAQITAEDLDFAGGSGTGSVDLDSQVLTIAGTTNEIETSASGQTLTIGLPSDVTIGNDLTVTNDLAVDTDTLFVDASADRVGINKNNPAVALDVVGDITSSGTVTGTTLTGTLSTAAQTNVTSVGTLSSLAVSGDLTVDTDTLKVDSANNRVGIGTSTVDSGMKLDVRGVIQSKGADSLIRMGQLSATATYIQSISADTTTSRDIVFFGTAERMRILSSGGITFNGDTAAANALDDYEEGTWTPAYAFATSGSATTTSTFGYYTKIGRQVTVQFLIITGSISSPTGDATITGLPFTSGATTTLLGGSIGLSRKFATDMPNLRIGMNPSSSVITLLKNATNSSVNVPVDGSDFNASATSNILTGTITYFA